MTENVRHLPARIEMPDVDPGPLAKLLPIDAETIRTRIHLIEELKRDLMKEGTHYGTIPGTPKPTLYQAGAELLALMFQLDAEISVDQIDYTDETGWPCFRAIARVVIFHTPSGLRVATSTGEADTGEERYRWHKTYDQPEWDATPEAFRREKTKGGRNGGNTWIEKQLRTHASDLRNTIVQMATKRGYVAGVKRATATSAMFTADLEDMPPDLRGNGGDGKRTQRQARPAQGNRQAQTRPTQQQQAQQRPAQHGQQASQAPRSTQTAAPAQEPAQAAAAADNSVGASDGTRITDVQVRNLLSLGALADFKDDGWRPVAEDHIGMKLEDVDTAEYVSTYKSLRELARGIAAT